jgi:two-component system, chemotaxis family, sensor kinase CheA
MIDTEILEDYSSEARELLDEMDHSLMRLEKEGPVPELLNNVFRAVHCIKGSAQYIGLESSSTLTHGVENLLDRLREGMLKLDPTIMEFLFRAKDLISTLIEEVAHHRSEKSDISTMMEQLDKILQRPPSGAREPSVGAPVPPDVPVTEELHDAEPEEPLPTSFEEEMEEAGMIGGHDTVALDTEEDAAVLEAEDYDSGDDLTEYEESLRKEVSALDEDLLDSEEEALYEPMSYVVREYDEEEVSEESEPPPFFSVSDMRELPTELHGEVDSETEHESSLSAEEAPITESIPGVSGMGASQGFVEGTVPHLLTISLYLDDFQDGFFHPSEIIPSLLETVAVVRDSFSEEGIAGAVEILDTIKSRLNSFDPESESLSPAQIQELRGLLANLRPHYPPELFPWGESEFVPTEPPAVPTEEAVAEPTPLVEEVLPAPTVFAAETGLQDLPAQEEPPQAQIVSDLAHEEVAPPPIAEPVMRTEGQHSMLADVDDELLRQFANEFETMFAPADPPVYAAVQPAKNTPAPELSGLAEGLEVSAEESDREIIEIFLAYGLEITDKLRPVVSKLMVEGPSENDLDACAEFINSIRSSATYMDYQKLASFLDDWYETTRALEERESVGAQDLLFMDENLDRFQDFLRDLQRALSPQATQAEVPAASVVSPVEPVQEAAVQSGHEPEEPRVEVREPQPPAAAMLAEPEQELQRPVENPPLLVPIIAEPQAPQEAPPVAAQRPPAAPALAAEPRALPEIAAAAESPAYADAQAAREMQEGAVVKTMRVDSAKVDTLLNQVGELVVNRSYVEQLALQLRGFHRSLMQVNRVSKKEIQSIKDLALKVGEASIALGRVATDIQEGVMKLRMLPVGQLFNRMPRLIRDLSRRVGKTVNLEVHGADTEVDKRVIEQIYNPLVHLIRNAVDHGIEDKEIRKKLGKSEEGLIILRAYSQGNQVSIDVEDDGAGINRSAVLEKAVQHRLIEAADAGAVSQQDVFNFLFFPGFSTSQAVTRTSGRGVGMDVVKKDVEKINGHVDIESWENEGTRISIKIPLTLAIIQTLLIRSVKHVFAIPLTSVREIIQVSQREITTIEGFEVIKFREETIPVLRISEVFHLERADDLREPRFLVLASAGPRTVGFLVEELIGEQDVVIKPLADHVFKNRGLAGSTILGDGTIALVLDVMELIDDIIAQQRQIAAQSARQPVMDAQYELN